ncbi:MAG TPA: OmpH family outer membrane protein [Longimicrobiales bacterium]|jgi:outer membrane protein
MHRLTLMAAGLLLLAAPQCVQGQAPPRIGYINSQAIVPQAPGYQQAESQFQQDMQTFQAQVQAQVQELDQMIQQYEQQQLTMAPATKQQREQAILTKQQEVQQAQSEISQQASARETELMQPIMLRINEVIERIRSEGAYAVIFDVAAGAIIAADPALDLTEEVVRRLQAQAGDTIGSGGSR